MNLTQFKEKYIRFFIDKKDKLEIFENLSILLNSYINISEALDALAKDETTFGRRKIVSFIKDDIDKGNPIWKTMENRKIIPSYLIPIVRVGEETGNLPEHMNIALRQIRKNQEFKSLIQSASLYPIIVLSIMLFVGSGIGLFILPLLADLYDGINAELPIITTYILALGSFLESYGLIAVPLFLAATVSVFYLVFFAEKTKYIGQGLLLRTPLVKTLLIEIELTRLGLLLGTLLKSGFQITDAFQLLSESTGLHAYSKFYLYLKRELYNGSTLGQALNSFKGSKKMLPVYVKQLIITSEKTASLSEALHSIGVKYEKRNETTAKNISTIIEPVLLVVIWIAVSVLAFAVILPIYNITGNVSNFYNEPIDTPEGPIRNPPDTRTLEPETNLDEN